jgi:hypothetical protein
LRPAANSNIKRIAPRFTGCAPNRILCRSSSGACHQHEQQTRNSGFFRAEHRQKFSASAGDDDAGRSAGL